MRGTLAALSVVVATTLSPAGAAPPPDYVVYELVPSRPAVSTVTVTTRTRVEGPYTLRSYLAIRPSGRGYTWRSMGISQSANGTHRTYGWPIAPECPAACDDPAAYYLNDTIVVRANPGDRYFFAGPRGRYELVGVPAGWRVRRVPLSFRAVLAYDSDASGVETTPGVNVEHFRSARAAGGPHGSAVFAQLPCQFGAGAGLATLTFSGAPMGDAVCGPTAAGWAFGDAPGPGTWELAGQAVGSHWFPARLVVFDYPRR